VGLLVRVRVQGLLFQWHGLKRHHILKINMIKFCFFKNTKHFSKSLANNFLCGVKKIIIIKKKKKKKNFSNINLPKKKTNFQIFLTKIAMVLCAQVGHVFDNDAYSLFLYTKVV